MPIDRFLVPEKPVAIPEGFARSRQALTRGVPFQWALEADLALVLLVPTGVASIWRDADPATVVSAGTDEARAHAAPRGADPNEQPAIRLLLRRARATLASIPLAMGLSRLTPDGDGAKTVIELFVAGWLLHAGALRGPGDFGSFVDVAWRRADKGVAQYLPAPIHPAVVARDAARAEAGIGPAAPPAPSPPPATTPPAATTSSPPATSGNWVIVTRQDANGRNLEFRDTRTGRIMTRAEFVTAIRAGSYPTYTVRMMNGVETPVSWANASKGDNLG